jgi:hypothetical protein
MNDAELIDYLGLTDCDPVQAQRYVASLTPAKRELFEKMLEVELSDRGLCPMPEGVIVCREHRTRGRE